MQNFVWLKFPKSLQVYLIVSCHSVVIDISDSSSSAEKKEKETFLHLHICFLLDNNISLPRQQGKNDNGGVIYFRLTVHFPCFVLNGGGIIIQLIHENRNVKEKQHTNIT